MTVRGKDARLLLDDGDMKSKVDGCFQVVADSVLLKASAAGIGLTSEVKVDGSQILLNSAAQATDSIESSEPEEGTIELVDQDGAPIPHQRFRVELDDGTTHVGFLDDEGKARVTLEGNGKIYFPDLSDAEQA